MTRVMQIVLFLFTLATAAVFVTTPSRAHFLWLNTVPAEKDEPQAFLYFGEDVNDQTYHFPEKLASIKTWQRTADDKRVELASEPLDTDERVGRVAALATSNPCVLEAAGQYGIYGTMLLDYCAKHVHATANDKLAAAGPSKDLKLDILPSSEDGQLTLTVLWEGKPLADTELMITVGDDDIIEAKTAANGKATVRSTGNGIVGVLANHTVDGVKGEVGGKEYSSRAYYSTVTFPWQAPTGKADQVAEPRAAVSALPEPLSSFGAVVADGWLYVYGGHIGKEHDHSAANLSNHFRRIRLGGTGDDSRSEWSELPMQTPLQGLPLVAHNGKIYRVGGLDARNPTTEEQEDLHSTAEFAEFDPSSGKWTALAPLPAPRSSHNAAVVGDRLYVVGGWELKGKSPGTWHPATLLYDFAKPEAGWQEVKELPHKRRALAASQWNGKLAALGGMDENGKMPMRFDLFDPPSGEWAEGPKLPGAGMSGFGVSAWNLDGKLYVCGFAGKVYGLNETGSKWEEVARLDKPRFFHQLVPAPGGGLLAVGGASQDGHLADIEWVDVAAVSPLPAPSGEATSARGDAETSQRR